MRTLTLPRHSFLIALSAVALGAGPDLAQGAKAEIAPGLQLDDLRVISADAAGTPTFITGDLGRLDLRRPGASAEGQMLDLAGLFGLSGSEDFLTQSVEEDSLGQIHIRLAQLAYGLPVEGATVVVHAWARTGKIYAIGGDLAAATEAPAAGRMGGAALLRAATQDMGVKDLRLASAPEATYVLDAEGRARFAFAAEIAYTDAEGDQLDRVFVAPGAGVVARHPQIHRALNRQVYDANNSNTLPGTLVMNEGGSSSDSSVMQAYSSAGSVYGYYASTHSRDSYSGAGATIKSVVHVGNNYNNAYWDGSYIAYGDGDGTTFTNFASAFDVVAHELTHAVTEYSADLVYSNESGALNEAMSDIMGASAEAWLDGNVSGDTWLIGEDCYTPGTAGDALRYMDDPTADGSSYDYYPERYTGFLDNGGVHLNSGIANLAYVLMVEGGSHPRGKTSVNVSGMGMAKAEAIFYRALTVYMTSSTNFQGARNATAQAADDLYGQAEVDAVHAAWNAVGVPGGPVVTNDLQPGVALTGLSGSKGSESRYAIDVPAGATNLVIAMSGGSGDADLYVRFGSEPTTSSYNCRPYKNGNNETCTFAAPSTGTYHIMLRAYATYSGVTLLGDYDSSAPNVAPDAGFSASTSDLTATFSDSSSDSDGSIASRSWSFGDGGTSSATNPSHTYAASGTYSVTLTVTDDDGATDSASSSVTVTAPVATPTPTPAPTPTPGDGPCPECDLYTGSLTGSGDAETQPNGTYYYAAAGLHEGFLEGPNGADFDLELYRWSGSKWSRVAKSTSASSVEDITYNGSAGYYTWNILSYSGAGSYAFYLNQP